MKRPLTSALAALLLAVFAVAFVPTMQPALARSLSATDAGEIDTSYRELTTEYYKKTYPKSIVAGARDGLLLVMRKRGVKSPHLPVLQVGTNAEYDIRAVEDQVERAVKQSGLKASPRLLTYAAIAGMLHSVHDRYTVFLTPAAYAGLNQSLDGTNFGGTGIVIQLDSTSKYITVSNVIPDGPADKAGVRQDDLITAIDGASTKGWSLKKASSRLRGKPGTNVTLTILRDDKAIAPIVVTRAEIQDLSVFSKMLPGKIGYVELTVFGLNTGRQLTDALDRLLHEGARAIVMDLRDNGGGYLNAAVAVSSKFIPSGPIVSVESRASNITTYGADDDAIPPLPLAVLVNKWTASASEITSGAIQDDGAGAIIGEKTFGKGVVQNIWPLGDGSAIKITTARYLTPHNRDINHRGIVPDIIVAENKQPSFGDPAKDAQLARAVLFLNDRLAHLGHAPTSGSN